MNVSFHQAGLAHIFFAQHHNFGIHTLPTHSLALAAEFSSRGMPNSPASERYLERTTGSCSSRGEAHLQEKETNKLDQHHREQQKNIPTPCTERGTAPVMANEKYLPLIRSLGQDCCVQSRIWQERPRLVSRQQTRKI